MQESRFGSFENNVILLRCVHVFLQLQRIIQQNSFKMSDWFNESFTLPGERDTGENR